MNRWQLVFRSLIHHRKIHYSVALGVIVGARIGARLAMRLSQDVLRLAFVAVAAIFAVSMFLEFLIA